MDEGGDGEGSEHGSEPGEATKLNEVHIDVVVDPVMHHPIPPPVEGSPSLHIPPV